MAGVLGVFVEDPNEAKAPDPRPNAEEAPTVGEVTLVAVAGEVVLKGLDLPWEDVSPPKRRLEGNARGESCFAVSLLLFEAEVDKDSLLELRKAQFSHRAIWTGFWLVCSYFDRRCHRLSIYNFLCTGDCYWS